MNADVIVALVVGIFSLLLFGGLYLWSARPFFWEPKKNIAYHNKDEKYEPSPKHLRGTETWVYFIDEEGEKQLASFKINDNEEVEIRLKQERYNQYSRTSLIDYEFGSSGIKETVEKRFYDISELSFDKNQYREKGKATGQGPFIDWNVKQFVYTVEVD